jgi:hypothetical protein
VENSGGIRNISFAKTWRTNEIERGEHRMNEKGLLDEIFELALQNDMNYLG